MRTHMKFDLIRYNGKCSCDNQVLFNLYLTLILMYSDIILRLGFGPTQGSNKRTCTR